MLGPALAAYYDRKDWKQPWNGDFLTIDESRRGSLPQLGQPHEGHGRSDEILLLLFRNIKEELSPALKRNKVIEASSPSRFSKRLKAATPITGSSDSKPDAFKSNNKSNKKVWKFTDPSAGLRVPRVR